MLHPAPNATPGAKNRKMVANKKAAKLLRSHHLLSQRFLRQISALFVQGFYQAPLCPDHTQVGLSGGIALPLSPRPAITAHAGMTRMEPFTFTSLLLQRPGRSPRLSARAPSCERSALPGRPTRRWRRIAARACTSELAAAASSPACYAEQVVQMMIPGRAIAFSFTTPSFRCIIFSDIVTASLV